MSSGLLILPVRRAAHRKAYVLLLLLCLTFAPSLAVAASNSVTFAQLTDSHVFDDGKKLPTADALRRAADDRDALYWAIDRINRYDKVNPIDFVVFTGDFGLENVDFSASGNCKVQPVDPVPGLPRVTAEWAVNETIEDFDWLKIRTVFVVPGNNDIRDEDIQDNARFDCFFQLLQAKGAGKGLTIQRLDATHPFKFKNSWFAGMNTASFKKQKNYAGCSGTSPGIYCPAVQIGQLGKPPESKRVFVLTHVPDLLDPFTKDPSWALEDPVRQQWDIVCNQAVAGIFAGHFHSSDRALYGTNIRDPRQSPSPCSAAKTWVAPPLAAKFQTDESHQARGFMVATVDGDSVQQVQVFWYQNFGPAAKGKCYPHRPIALWIALVVALAGMAYLLIAGLRGWTNRHRDLTAVVIAILFTGFAFVLIHYFKAMAGTGDSAVLIALLVLPLLLYGIVSGRLTEFSGPGGWGAKFNEVASQPVDILAIPFQPDNVQEVAKESLLELQQKIGRGEINKESSIALTLTLGVSYDSGVLTQCLVDLSRVSNLRFLVIKDSDNKAVVAYFRPQSLVVDGTPAMGIIDPLVNAVSSGQLDALKRVPEIQTELLNDKMSNAEALRTMDRLSLDAMPVVKKRDKSLLAIAWSDRIIRQMLITLVTRH